MSQIRSFAHRVLEIALTHRATASQRPVGADQPPDPVDVELRADARSEEEILEQLQSLIEGAANTESPDFIAHMGAFPTAASALGDFVAATVNNNMIGLELSPTFSRLEQALAKEFAGYFGLPDTAGGLIATGGSLSNLHAMAVARNVVLDTLARSVHRLEGPPVLFASAEAHASVKKNAMLLGLGTEGVVPVSTDADSRMDPDDLGNKIVTARSEGKMPFCVIATAGSTVTGNIDPIRQTGRIAKQHGLWYHVDAAWGGGLQFSEKYRDRLAGIETADSITFCPQKLLLVALSSSLTLFRDWDRMHRSFRVTFSYLKDSGTFIDRSEIGVQGSRPAEVLKLWLSMLHVGTSAYGAMIERWVELADSVARAASEREEMEVASLPESAIVCFRATPRGLSDEASDAYNEALHQYILAEEGVYLSFVPYKGHTWLRAVFQNPYVESEITDRVFGCIDRFAARGELCTNS